VEESRRRLNAFSASLPPDGPGRTYPEPPVCIREGTSH